MIPDFNFRDRGLDDSKIIRSSLARPTEYRCGKTSHSGSASLIKAPWLPPEVVNSGFSVKILPRFLASPIDLQS